MRVKNFWGFCFMSCTFSLLVSCSSTQNYTMAVNSWQGAHEDTLVKDWGHPDKVTTLANGNRLVTYREEERETFPQTYLPSPTRISPQRTNSLSRPALRANNRGHYTYWCDTTFEVNKENRIVNTHFQGNNCYATEKNAQRWAYAR